MLNYELYTHIQKKEKKRKIQVRDHPTINLRINIPVLSLR